MVMTKTPAMEVSRTGRGGAVHGPSGEASGKVTDNPAESRFELATGGEPAIAGYSRKGKVLDFNHTVVPAHLRGKGIAENLITGALRIVRDRGEKFTPTCSYVRAYVGKHPEVQDLLA